MKNSREKIFTKLKAATSISSDLPMPPEDLDDRILEALEAVTPKDTTSLWSQFSQEVENVSGECFRVSSIEEAVRIVTDIAKTNQYNRLAITAEKVCQTIAGRVSKTLPSLRIIQTLELPLSDRKEILSSVRATLVEASFAVADIGSLVFLYDETGTSLPHFLAECVVAFVHKKNILANQFDLFKTVPSVRAKHMVLVTGPSRTADIEKVLILGAHGPRQLVVVMYDF